MIRRGIAASLGGFVLVNLIGGAFVPHFNANLWWIRLPALPGWLAGFVLLLAGASLLAFAFGFTRHRWARRIGVSVLTLVAVFALVNCVEFYGLALRGQIRPWVPIPLSLFIVAALVWITVAICKPKADPPHRRWHAVGFVATCGTLAVAFPLMQMFFFGTTDYRRPADVAVVLGARTYADGTASQALSDRVKTAIGLYHEGLVTRLVFSGGAGDGAVSEPEAMRRMAIDAGVPDAAIVLDEAGLNTDATVRNTCAAFDRLGARRILVVSHAYHLPRVKLAYQRAGREVRTVPAT